MIDLLVDTSASTVDLQEHSTDLSVLTDFQRSTINSSDTL